MRKRKEKKECDWGNWKDEYSMHACLDYDDCMGCGAFKKFEDEMKEIINEIKKESKNRHIRDVLEQYDEGLLLDLLQYFFQKRIIKRDLL